MNLDALLENEYKALDSIRTIYSKKELAEFSNACVVQFLAKYKLSENQYTSLYKKAIGLYPTQLYGALLPVYWNPNTRWIKVTKFDYSQIPTIVGNWRFK